MSNWISVSDRLPEADIEVLVWSILGLDVATWTGSKWYDKECNHLKVTDWQELPNPPTDEQ